MLDSNKCSMSCSASETLLADGEERKRHLIVCVNDHLVNKTNVVEYDFFLTTANTASVYYYEICFCSGIISVFHFSLCSVCFTSQ